MNDEPNMKSPSQRRYDPERRERIIRATLDVISKHGVAGTTHRRIASAADVPLGSMTYHFAGMDDLLTHAFTRLAETVSAYFSQLLEAATTREEARAAVVEIISGGSWTTPQNLQLSFELYAYAGRNPALKPVMLGWMARSRSALELHFSAATARALDAMIEGISIHNSVDGVLISREEVADIVSRLTA